MGSSNLSRAYNSIPPGWKVELIQRSARGKYNVARLVNAIGGCVIEVKTEAGFDLLEKLFLERLCNAGYYE